MKDAILIDLIQKSMIYNFLMKDAIFIDLIQKSMIFTYGQIQWSFKW